MKPKKKEYIEDGHIESGDTYPLSKFYEDKGYNQAIDDYDKYHEEEVKRIKKIPLDVLFRESLPSEDEILEMVVEWAIFHYGNTGMTDHNKRVLAKTISQRIHK